MKHIVILLFSAVFCVSFKFFDTESSLKILSWNIRDLGKSKDNEEIAFIANQIKSYDIISIQEVVAGYGGAQAVAKIVDELNKSGNWDYSISDPTNSSSGNISEKYAFVWNTKKAQRVGNSWLEKKFDAEMEREPFFTRFSFGSKTITLVDFHARPRESQPETEVKYFKFFPEAYPDDILVFACDFNLPENHTVFNPIKKLGFKPAIVGQKTSLKKTVDGNGNYLMHEKDNIFYDANKLTLLASGVMDFVPQCNNIEEANLISDHLGVWISVQ